MAFLGRNRTATAAGTIVTLALVLIFGNQAFTEWVGRHTHADTVWGWFLRILCWPTWAFGPSNGSTAAMRTLLAHDLRAFLLIVFVAAILAVTAKSIAGGAGAFVLGWAALVFASALAAFLTAFITSETSWLTAFADASSGSAYGLFVGWIVGIAVAGAKSGGAAATP
jgi:hypothetical protein